MGTSLLSAKEPQLSGLRVLVVGLGRSGLAAARLAAARGAHVLVADRKPRSEMSNGIAQALALGATVHCGGHPQELAGETDLVILSPGVPASLPIVLAARARGVPVWSEVELAWRFCRGRVVGITGSNGKSTTTSMAGTILRTAGIPGGTGGNLGTPFADLLSLDGPTAVHAVELSSFQLETVDRFQAAVAAILNLSPDHLDRYPSYDAYAAAKARIFETQGPRDASILNADDPDEMRFSGAVRGELFRFSTRGETTLGAFVRAGRIVVRLPEEEDELMDAREIPVPGEHNLANALVAALACRLVGCAPEAIADGLRAYRALPHRLQYVGTLDGVAFYDDSKATNLDAAVRALRSFPAGRVHVILGGRDKGADWSALFPVIREQARRALLVGEAAAAIRKGVEGAVPLEDCGTIRTAVRVGFDGAAPGDVVLLAPGCASFDQYGNFEERGRDFRGAVEALFPEGTHHA